ncbi:MAG TPA: hypothetical protein IAC41_11890, partial [Candidatus Merdenecus merdavium]|nr:hypothetical protein [Candidatus Merdenecus merdavium]
MRKYFEYLSGKPQKFFIVDRMCTKIFTIEGKLGSKGKLDEKNYVSEEVAIIIYEKHITEKLAEGYVEGDEDNPTLPEPIKKKAASSKAKSKAPTEAWHKNNYWHYGTYDNKVLADLTKDAERKKRVSRSRYNDDDEDLTPYDKTSPDWDENFPEERKTLQYKFEKACRIQNLAWIEKYLKEGANINSKVGYDQLSTLAALIDDSHFGEGDTIEVLKYLIKNGVDYNDETIDETIEDESSPIFGECISAFRKNPDINKIDALFDSILQPIWDKLANEIIEYIRKILTTYHEVGEKYFEMRIKTSVYKNEVSFIFYTNEGNQTTVNTVTGEKFEFTTELPIKGLSATCGFNNLFHRLEKPLLKIKEEGLFNIIALSEFAVGMEDAYEVVHPFFTIVNEEKRKVEKEDFEQKLKRLETKEEWEPWTDGIEVAHILFNGKGLVEPDERRAMNILKGMLFSTKNKEHRRAWYRLLDTADKPYGAEAYYNLVMYCLADKGSFDSWSTERLEKSANLGYEPAIKLLAEENAKNVKPKSDKLLPFDKRFTPEELFLETDLISIRASEDEGYVRLVFKTESEEAYSQALDFINNLLSKEYAYHFDGYQLMVKFIEEPILGIPSFPNTPANAFFGKAVSYINLRPKVAEYATLGFARGGQYLEINGSEVNTVVGSFAAGALAIADIKYLYLLDEYVSNVDGEHECVQLELIEELNDAHGEITPEMVPTIVDLATSYDQPGDYGTPEVLYTNPQNLKAILHHFLTSKKYQRSPGDSLVM